MLSIRRIESMSTCSTLIPSGGSAGDGVAVGGMVTMLSSDPRSAASSAAASRARRPVVPSVQPRTDPVVVLANDRAGPVHGDHGAMGMHHDAILHGP